MQIPMESLMGRLGSPGRYQIGVFLLLAFNYIPVTFNHLVMAFFASTPRMYFCTHPSAEPNALNMVVSPSVVTDSYVVANQSVVAVDYGKCSSMYLFDDGSNMTVDCTVGEAGQWSYIKGQRESTIVTEWNLVCDSSYLGKLATTVYFVGVMVGGLVFGFLADKLGRKPVMLVTLYLPVLIGLGISFANSYILFMVLRFFQGIFMQGLQTSTYVLTMELFLPQYRGVAGAVLECYWGITVVMLAGVAYLLQSWRYIQLAISLPSLLALPYIWLIPESPRWLLTRRRFIEAEKWIGKIAWFNGVEYPAQLMENIKLQLDQNDTAPVQQFSFSDLVSTPKMRKRSLILFYLWFAVAIGYYGLSLNVTSLPGNKYLNFFIGGSVELVAFILVVVIIKRFERRKCLLTFFLVGAMSCIGAGIISFFGRQDSRMSQIATGFAIFGKFGMGGVFSLTFLYTSELYPTVIRNIGMGSCAFWARFGGVVAPLVLMLGDVTHKSASVVVFGIIALIGGFVTLLLPETLGRKLADTIEDTETVPAYLVDQNGHDMAAQKLTTENGNL